MKTREQELAELENKIYSLEKQARETRIPSEKEKFRNLADGLRTTGRRLINDRHDRQDAEQTARAADAAARLARVEAQQEATIRSELRARWQGSQADFERLYPTMRDQWLADRALGRVAVPPAFGPPKATL